MTFLNIWLHNAAYGFNSINWKRRNISIYPNFYIASFIFFCDKTYTLLNIIIYNINNNFKYINFYEL